MSSLYYELDHAAWQIKEAAKNENATVRNRIKKLCEEMRKLRPWVLNAAEPIDFFPIGEKLHDYLLHPEKHRKHFCSCCGKDISLSGGWIYPQEPKKVFCNSCESKRFAEQHGEPANREPANGDTRPPCYADNGNAPYCAGRDCPEWSDCHGDKLRGHSDTRGALP